MTQQFRYVKKAARKLHCSKEKKNDFRRQLASDIASALESGESWESVQKRLGTPAEIAREMNESLGDTALTYQKKKQKICFSAIGGAIVISAILIVIFITLSGGSQRQEETTNPAGTESGQEALSHQEAISLSEKAIQEFNQEDFDAVIQQGDKQLKNSLSSDSLQQAKEQTMPEAGQFRQIESSDAIRITDKGLSYTTVQIKVRYTNQTVMFTISWNDKKQLCGFYLRGDAYE